jgi:hypothetical protein
MSHSIKGMQKALSQFRFNSSLDDTSKKQMFGHLVDSIRARVASDPLEALNELSETYNAIVNRKLTLKVDKHPTTAMHQENIVLHALQTMYKQNLERYLKDLHGKSESEKKAAVSALENNHKKIINQKTGVSTVNIKQIITTLLQATSPRPVMPTAGSHAPSSGSLKWHDDTVVKNNLIKTFVQTYHTHLKNRDKLSYALKVKDDHYSSLDQSGIDQLTSKLEGMHKRMVELTEDPDPKIRAAATQVLVDAGLQGKAQDKFLHQLLSGYKNPLKLKAKENPEYTEDEIAQYAHSLLALMKPEEIFSQINTFYQESASPALKEKLISNAMILLYELIIVDSAGEIFPDLADNPPVDNIVVQQFNNLLNTIKNDTALDPARRKQLFNFEKHIKTASAVAADLKEKTQEQTKAMLLPSINKAAHLDVDAFITTDLYSGNVDNKKVLQAAKVVAGDFKRIALAHFGNIKATDLYGQAWNKPSKKDKTHALSFIRYCDRLSNLVINDIVEAKSTPHQVNVALFYADVLQESLKENDYATAAAIYGAFNKTSVFRLEHLKQHKGISKILASAKEVLQPDSNFKNLRAEIAQNKHKAVVPFFGMYATDLTFADDKIPDLDEHKDVNRAKLDVLKDLYLDLNNMIQTARTQKASGQSSSILSRVNKTDINDEAQFQRSQAFRARSIETSRTSTLAELLAKFPNQKVPLFLEIKMTTKNKEQVLTNKRAYKAILKVIIEQAHGANVVEKAAAAKLVNNILLAAQKNNIETEKLTKLVRAAQLVTDVGEESVETISFLQGALEKYYNVLALKAELEGNDENDSAKHLATKAEEIYHGLTKAAQNPEARIAKMATEVLRVVDLMNSIPTLSQKYKALKLSLTAVQYGPDSLKTQISIHDQMDKIEDQLREMSKHSDPRISIPSRLALEENKISQKKELGKFKKAELQKDMGKKQPAAMLMSQQRKGSSVVELPVRAVESHKSSAFEPVVLSDFLNDLKTTKKILESFNGKPKFSQKGYHSLQLILKELKEKKPEYSASLVNSDFNISFQEYNKHAAITMLDYVTRTLRDSSSSSTIERLIKETARNWPEGNIFLTKLKEDLAAENDIKMKHNPRA